MRWTDPVRGEISPGIFVPTAQESGLMPVIGRWVACSAAAQVGYRQREGLADGATLHVNFSLAEPLDPALPGDVANAVGVAGLPPERFCFEVTEADLLAGGLDAANAGDELADCGFRPVLADCGPQPRIETLTRYPFAFAKIGRSLLIKGSAPPHWRRLLRGLRGLCNTLGITLVAGGVGGQSELQRIAALGFGHAQRYAFGRPQTPATMGHSLGSGAAWGSTVA